MAAIAIAGLTPHTGVLASADPSPSSNANDPTIVLVHGAWADGSSWSEVSAQLQAAGYDVRIPPNNLRGVDSDATDVASYVSALSGPIVLVGHSYGGMVITNAATGVDSVRALVYVDAVIPEEGDTMLALTHPPSIFAQDPANVLDFVPYEGAPPDAVDSYVKPSVWGEAFANDEFSAAEIAVLAASQRPLSTAVFSEPSGPPAWATIPSWAVVGEADRIFPVADQISMAEHAGAQIVQIDAPHLSMLTDAQAITDVIVTAATTT